MIKGYKISDKQKDLLLNKEFMVDSYFNPIQDIDDSWFIFTEEVEQCTNQDFEWLKDLTLSDFIPNPKSNIEL
jgi:hypothetical protein